MEMVTWLDGWIIDKSIDLPNAYFSLFSKSVKCEFTPESNRIILIRLEWVSADGFVHFGFVSEWIKRVTKALNDYWQILKGKELTCIQ